MLNIYFCIFYILFLQLSGKTKTKEKYYKDLEFSFYLGKNKRKRGDLFQHEIPTSLYLNKKVWGLP